MNKNFTRDYIVDLIRSHQKELQDMGVKSLSIFGSAARNELQAESDIDVLVEISQNIGLFKFHGIKRQMEAWFSRPVDLATPNGLHPRLKKNILQEKIDVF